MIEPTRAAAAETGTGGAVPAAAAKTTKSFAGELARSVRMQASSEAKAAERPDGEITKKIAGHPYSRIENGADRGMYVNQVAGGPREGAIFRLVERGDRVYHVYGTGKDNLIIGLEAPTKTGAPATT